MLNKTLIGFRSCKRAFFIRQLAALGGGCPPVGPVALRRPLSRVVLLTWEEPHPYFIGKVHKMLWEFVSFSSTEPISCFPAHVRPDFMRNSRIIIHSHIGPHSVACQKQKQSENKSSGCQKYCVPRAWNMRESARLATGCRRRKPPLGPVASRRPLSRVVPLTWSSLSLVT